jgi:hypothetical protein
MSVLFLASLTAGFIGQPLGEPAEPTPESRALAYLITEVPSWSVQNKCFSCHNNGDAARALYTAVRLGYPVPAKALADTTTWLARPQQWEDKSEEGGFTDKGLLRIQFAAALAAALDAGQVKVRPALARAAELVAERQQPDGSWPTGEKGSIGSPVTYGTGLATYLARHTLHEADRQRYRTALARADQWFLKVPVKAVLDAAAVLLALEGNESPEAAAQRRQCLALIRQGQSKDGGWGPYVTSPPEPFDTAVVVLALARQTGQVEAKTMLQNGRAYLVARQEADGSWPETTRPAGAQSYAQRLSTAGWATLALLATRGEPARR